MQKMHNQILPCSMATKTLGLRHKRLAAVALLLVASLSPWQAQAQTKSPAPARIKIAAASNLKFVLADLAAQYKQETGVQVEVNWGASGNLARQIVQGLPVEQFISADEAWVEELVKTGRTVDAGQRYAMGRLALILPKNSALPLSQGLAAVVRAMKPGDKFAIANPALAPYGVSSVEVLQRAGLGPWTAANKVLGDNIGQATQFVASGAAQAGITALAWAQAPEIAQHVQAWPLPTALHAPLHQRMVLLKGAGQAATDRHRFLLSPSAQAVFVRHGYALPQ